MKLNHLNLTVTDVDATRVFLEKYFGMQYGGSRGNAFAVMYDEDRFILTLMNGGQVKYPSTFHIGFAQKSEERVNEIYQHMKDDGLAVKPPERSHAWTFYVEAPGGFVVEVLC